jgi:hypothetical protein
LPELGKKSSADKLTGLKLLMVAALAGINAIFNKDMVPISQIVKLEAVRLNILPPSAAIQAFLLVVIHSVQILWIKYAPSTQEVAEINGNQFSTLEKSES